MNAFLFMFIVIVCVAFLVGFVFGLEYYLEKKEIRKERELKAIVRGK